MEILYKIVHGNSCVHYIYNMKTTLFFCVILVLASCIPPVAPNTSVGDTLLATDSVIVQSFEIAQVRPEIDSMNTNWSKGLKAGDVSQIMKLYDERAHLLPDGDYYYDGLKQIETYWISTMNYTRDMQIQTTSLEGNEDVLYETGLAYKTILKESQLTGDTSKYVTVWKKQPEGGYKVMTSMWNNMPGRK